MRKKMLLKILAGITAFLIILAVFIISNSIVGNPISASIAKSKATAYINDQYSQLNLKISDVGYNLKDGSYLISVSSDTSIDTHFFLGYRDGVIIRDDYEILVLSGINTMDRFCNEYENSIKPLVQAKTDDVTNITVIPEKLSNYNIDLDSAFDKKLTPNVTVIISSTGGTDAKHLSDVLMDTYEVMKENGYLSSCFGITSEYESAVTELRNIKPTHIDSDNLEEILQKAINKTEYEGITAFIKGQK